MHGYSKVTLQDPGSNHASSDEPVSSIHQTYCLEEVEVQSDGTLLKARANFYHQD